MSWHAGTSFDGPIGSSVTQSPTAHAAATTAHTSPATERSPDDSTRDRKRKRSSIVEHNGNTNGADDFNSPASLGGVRTGSVAGDGTSPTSAQKPRHQPGVKRACNDCRQQKLRCNVIASNNGVEQPCARCIKHNLHCSIDNDFKRLGKRAAHEEMVKELETCRAQLAEYEALGIALPSHAGENGRGQHAGGLGQVNAPIANMTNQPFLGPNEAAASRSLLDLSQGFRELAPTAYPSITPGSSPKTLGSVTITDDEMQELYGIYFTSFHPFMPLLSPELPYSSYYNFHPLLHWTVIAVAARRYDSKPGLLVELQHPLIEMLWTTLSQVPQTYHVCKALALLCTWPLPNSSTSQEPTMLLTGAMFQLAMQYGLHRPSHAQDFSRFRIELREEDIADRLNTWAAVNIVAQNVATGQGQPPLSRWAWFTYGLHLDRMKPELQTRCQIEKFCDTVTRTIFTMQRDHIVEVDQAQRGLQIDMYSRELGEMEVTILSTGSSRVDILYLKAAALHLRLSAFFDKPNQPNYYSDLRNVYIAASSMLRALIELPKDMLLYIPRYLESMILAGGVTLLKILNSFYASQVDVPAGRTLFGRSVGTLRDLSVRSNDLPQRLAEVLAQLWQSSGASEQKLFNGETGSKAPDDSLQLKVRCRSSLSVLYDSIWRWRNQAGESGRNNLDRAAEHPTVISGIESHARNTPQPIPNNMGLPGANLPATGLPEMGGPDLDGLSWENSYGGNAVFDPLSWALDGNLNFPSSFVEGGMQF